MPTPALLEMFAAYPVAAAGASIAFDASASGSTFGASAASYSKTIAHTIGGGSQRLVVVCIQSKTAASPGTLTVSVCTYNGVAMTQAASTVSAGNRSLAAIFYMLEAALPAAGTYNVVVTAADSGNKCSGVVGEVYSFTGAKQSAQPDATAVYSDDTGGTTITKSITTVADNSWAIDSFSDRAGATFGTPNGSQTHALGAASGGSAFTGMGSTLGPITPAGSTSMGWTLFGTATGISYAQASFSHA